MKRAILRVRALAWVGIGLCLVGGHALVAQGPAPAPSLPPPINQSDDPILKPFVWRSIGPANMGGRVDDIAVVDSDPSIIYIGFATGGIWKTTNNGTTWTPIFDTYPVSSIGDIAIAPSNPEIIYVGTGEPNNRQSSSFGAGVYKSTDGGKSFQEMGLKDTQSIGRIVVHPKDPNIVYVAALGHLFGPNQERGLYKTTDGGKTWTNTKFIDQDTGFTDVAIDPANPNILYRRFVSAPPHAVGLQWRRARQRIVENGGCRQDVDETDVRSSEQSDHRPNRARHRALQTVDHLRVDRSRTERRHGSRRQR